MVERQTLHALAILRIRSATSRSQQSKPAGNPRSTPAGLWFRRGWERFVFGEANEGHDTAALRASPAAVLRDSVAHVGDAGIAVAAGQGEDRWRPPHFAIGTLPSQRYRDDRSVSAREDAGQWRQVADASEHRLGQFANCRLASGDGIRFTRGRKDNFIGGCWGRANSNVESVRKRTTTRQCLAKAHPPADPNRW
jgi:hypothetical protein